MWRAKKKSGWGVSWTTSELSASTPTSGGLQPRTRENGARRRNKGRNILWRNGSLQRNPRLWTAACSGMLGRDWKDQGEDIPKQASKVSELVLVRSPLLTNHKWCKLVSCGRLVCRCHDVFLWCYVCFVLLRFRLYALSLKPRPFVQRFSILRRCPDSHTRVSFFFPFVYLEMSLFPNIFCIIAVFSLYGEYVVRFFLPDGAFLSCGHGLDF